MSQAAEEAPHLLFEREGHVAIVTMNRPRSRNAWSLEMMARMADAWEEIDTNPDIRVAILTGAGGSFCSGSDLKALDQVARQIETVAKSVTGVSSSFAERLTGICQALASA